MRGGGRCHRRPRPPRRPRGASAPRLKTTTRRLGAATQDHHAAPRRRDSTEGTMLDLKFVREHPDVVKAAAKKKRMSVDVDAVLELDRKRRELVTKLDQDRAEQNRLSKS